MRKIEKILQLLDTDKVKPATFERKNELGNGYLMKVYEGAGDITEKMLQRIRKNSTPFYQKLTAEFSGNGFHDSSPAETAAKKPDTIDKLADSNHMLADSVHRMVLMLEEKEKTLGEIKSSLAQMPADMIALTAKLLEGQQGLRKELQHVTSHLSKDRSKTPSRQ